MAYISSYQKQSLRTTILNGEMKSDQELGELHSVVDGEQLGGVKNHETPSLFLNHESQNISIAFPLGN